MNNATHSYARIYMQIMLLRHKKREEWNTVVQLPFGFLLKAMYLFP